MWTVHSVLTVLLFSKVVHGSLDFIRDKVKYLNTSQLRNQCKMMMSRIPKMFLDMQVPVTCLIHPLRASYDLSTMSVVITIIMIKSAIKIHHHVVIIMWLAEQLKY